MGENIRRYDVVALKWKQSLRPKIAKFTAVYERVKQRDENGSSDLVVFQNALAEYETQYGHAFTLEPCWRILKNCPVWTELEMPSFNRTNFNDWFRQLKLVLRVEKKMFVIEQPIPSAPAVDSEANVLVEWNAIYDAHNEVACLMLRSMTLELHRQFENYSPYEMLHELKSMFEKQARVERSGKIQKANKKSLKAKGKGKANGKGKDKQVYIPKPKNPKPSAKEHPAKDDTCHHCKEVGHWKRNCPV
ncbi:retrotransposon protein, putative, ty1-copia subclass, partial [Tanacetum coccineum]